MTKKSFNKKEVSGKYFLTKSDQKSLLRCACAWKTKSLLVPVLICQRQCYCVVAMAERLRLRFYPPYVSTEGSVGCCFFSLSGLDISATVTPISVKLCMTVHISVPDRSFPLEGRYPWDALVRNFLA